MQTVESDGQKKVVKGGGLPKVHIVIRGGHSKVHISPQGGGGVKSGQKMVHMV